MKTVTLTVTMEEAEDLDYALVLACNDCTKRGWEARSFKIDMIRDRLSWRIEEAIKAQEEDDALNGRR